jgi:hypothetical protein
MALFLPLAAVCAGIILYRYYRARRLAAGIGWTLIIIAIGASGSGLAEAFSWSGFVFLFTGAAGMLIVLQEAFFRRQTRRRRQRAGQYDLEHRA